MQDARSGEGGFAGRVALVTGGSKGIGRACVQSLARRGATVGFTHRRDDASVGELLDWAASAGADVFAIRSDATDPDGYAPLRDAVTARSGGRLDILVNNVGDPIRRSSFAESDAAMWEQCVAVNLLSAVRATLAFLPVLRQSEAAVVVNVSSIAGTTTGAGDSLHYGTAKAALDTFTVGLAREMKASPVRVVGVAPGVIDTDFHARHSSPERLGKLLEQTPIQRAGTAGEIGEIVAWLASDDCAYVSGSVLKVSGGR